MVKIQGLAENVKLPEEMSDQSVYKSSFVQTHENGVDT